ncbi:histidine phosphatase family protein [Sulfurospirillum diekertiae]|uniref:Histidine phosphatase superfamily protein n=1 Tax=Sulfurospirillum diekertiae TaxID=1854492 RepID=A0A1Y0HLW6_9BACT|nr:histidine phosphatase family protein [Sulfurospirillum diekertiae]ARU49088.1 Histidine phosphatase superfamily protein [Sulfurospirillum diekertiae]ASC93901.1 Histidine phosphatase superfamily protein [Sulfurospirillum diekertiae]
MVDKVYLLRHGHIDNGSEKRYLGRTNIPLNRQGKEQAHILHDYFKAIPIDMIFTSPLKRCLQTARILCVDKPITYHIVEAFAEIDMGDWENVEMSYIASHNPELYAQRGGDLEYFTPPNGESFHDMAKRVRDAFDAITHHATGTLLIVAHAGVNRMILSYILGIEIRDMFTIEQPYACVNELTWNQQCMQWNYQRVL